MNRRPVLRIKEFAVERNVRAQFRVFFSGASLTVNFENDFRGHPTTTQPHVLVELGLLRLRSIFSAGTNHAHKVEILLIDPELRRMQITLLRADNIDWATLPSVFAKD